MSISGYGLLLIRTPEFGIKCARVPIYEKLACQSFSTASTARR